LTPPRRKITSDAVKHQLLVFVEGEVTEDEYLTHYRKLHRRHTAVEIDPFHGGPLQLVQWAVKAKRAEERAAKRRGRAHDEVWCVFDVDQHPNLEEAIALAVENDVNVAVSNPCLELWFLLHFSPQTAYIERHEAQHRAKEELNCGKRLVPEALARLEEAYETAKERAIALEKMHRANDTAAPGNPSSGMWSLVDSISSGDQR
jgi:hypothetical protein